MKAFPFDTATAKGLTPRERAINQGVMAALAQGMRLYQDHGIDDPWGGLSIIKGPDGEEIDLEYEMELTRFGLGPAI